MINEDNKVKLLKMKLTIRKKSRDQYAFSIKKAYMDDEILENGFRYIVYIDLSSKEKDNS